MDYTTLSLAYGSGQLPVQIPTSNLLGIFEPIAVIDGSGEKELIIEAMTQPIGSPRLCDLARRGQKVAIVTSDLTRPCPSQHLLPYILRELAGAGIPDTDIMIILGLGLHRPMTPAEIDTALSPEIAHRYRVLNHDPADTDRLGVTSFGTPVEIFRPLIETDLRLCLGALEFHYFAGYSGGAKAIFPGCASRAAVTANHAMMVRPEAAAGRIEGNPVRADLEEATAMLGVDYILNVLVDGEHRIVGAVSGDVTAAHRRGCELVARRGKVQIPALADIVLASAGGYPKDINFYQAHKALENAVYAVRPGGVIVLVAECPEGFGNQTFESWFLSGDSPEQLLQRIQEQFVLGGHKAASIAAIRQKACVSLVSNLPDDTVQRGGFIPYPTPQAALGAAFDRLGSESRVIVLPHAGSLLPSIDYSSPE